MDMVDHPPDKSAKKLDHSASVEKSTQTSWYCKEVLSYIFWQTAGAFTQDTSWRCLALIVSGQRVGINSNGGMVQNSSGWTLGLQGFMYQNFVKGIFKVQQHATLN